MPETGPQQNRIKASCIIGWLNFVQLPSMPRKMQRFNTPEMSSWDSLTQMQTGINFASSATAQRQQYFSFN